MEKIFGDVDIYINKHICDDPNYNTTLCNNIHDYDVNCVIGSISSVFNKIRKIFTDKDIDNIVIIPYTCVSFNIVNIYIKGINIFISELTVEIIKDNLTHTYMNNPNLDETMSTSIITYICDIINLISYNLSFILVLIDNNFNKVNDTTYECDRVKFNQFLINKINYVNDQYLLLYRYFAIHSKFDYIYFYANYALGKTMMNMHLDNFLDNSAKLLVKNHIIIDKYIQIYNDAILYSKSISFLVMNYKLLIIRAEKNNNFNDIDKLYNKIEAIKLVSIIYNDNKNITIKDIEMFKNICNLSISLREHVYTLVTSYESNSDSDNDSEDREYTHRYITR